MSKVLLAGSWVGEFGWELFCWQGYLRSIANKFDKVIVICRTGNDVLYNDFTNDFIFYNPPFTKTNMWMGEENKEELKEMLEGVSYNYEIKPFNIGFGHAPNNDFFTSDLFQSQVFRKYKSDVLDKTYDILVHPRNKFTGSERNWDKEKWQELVDRLKSKYSIAMIGSNEAFELDGIDNYRCVVTSETISLMNRAKLVIGQSSGAMHLASLCGTPHLVWSDQTNKLRYEKYWNPFKTPVYFYDKKNWNPDVDDIELKVKEILK